MHIAYLFHLVSQGESYNYKDWWRRQVQKYERVWNDVPDDRKQAAIAAAEREFYYRTAELAQLSTRTTMLVSVAFGLFAIQGLTIQRGGQQTLLATIGLALTLVAVLAALMCYKPPLAAWRAKMMPAETWAALIITPQDEFTEHLMRANRKTKVIDLYKRLHLIAIPSLMLGACLALASFIVR